MVENLEGRIVSSENISESQKLEMFGILKQNFEGYVFDNFVKDLVSKDDVILLENKIREIKGFTTIKNFNTDIGQKKVRGLFSGDTIIQQDYWNKHDLFKVWLNYAFEKSQEDTSPLYWFLISSGCRTYKIIPTFFNDFYPNLNGLNSAKKQLLDEFGNYMFEEDYDSDTGLIKFSNSKERLNKELAKIDPAQLKNPYVSYFLKKNPKYYEGVELACVVEISYENLRSFGKRLLNDEQKR